MMGVLGARASSVTQLNGGRERKVIPFSPLSALRGTMYYELDEDHEVIAWRGNIENLWKRVEVTNVGSHRISTIFFGCPMEDGDEWVFQTAIKDETGHYQELVRYRSWDEAVAGHQVLVDNYWWDGHFPKFNRGMKWLIRKLAWKS